MDDGPRTLTVNYTWDSKYSYIAREKNPQGINYIYVCISEIGRLNYYSAVSVN